MLDKILKIVLFGRFFLISFFAVILILMNIYSYPIPYFLLFFLLFISGLINLNFMFKKPSQIKNIHLFYQANVDLIWIGLFFFFAGGYKNPLIFLMLIPMVSAALTLYKKYLIIYSIESIITFFLVCFYTQPISHLSMNYFGGFSGNLNLWGVLIAYLIITSLIVWYFFWIMQLNRESDEEFSKAKELLLKKDKNIHMTSFAATTAHQLGTPMATIAMKYEELRRMVTSEKAKDALEVIKSQLFKCKDIIKSINNYNFSKSNKNIQLSYFVKMLKDFYSQSMNSIKINFNYESKQNVKIKYDDMLFHSIIHIIDNAIHDSKSMVRVSLFLDNQNLVLEIQNDGKKFKKNILDDKPKSKKDFGMGMGLYLSKIIIERYEGSLDVHYVNKTNVVKVCLPQKSVIYNK